jgi:glycosyltransferase involved in cell wall biosynthesis
MNRLSIVTVVKNDFNSLKSTYWSIKSLAIDYEWIVIDGGVDQETLLWMRLLDLSHVIYLREQDKNLYDAMNKGILIASGTHVVFINAGDELNNSTELMLVLNNLPIDNGFMGSIRRNRINFLNWTLRRGITPANHQATIYPSIFLKFNLYDIELGLFADQISIIELLKTQPVQISRKIVVSTFKNGGLGDNQSRGAFLEQMCKYNFQNGTNLQKLILILQLPIILIAKVILSILHRIRILFSR